MDICRSHVTPCFPIVVTEMGEIRDELGVEIGHSRDKLGTCERSRGTWYIRAGRGRIGETPCIILI